MAAAQTPEATAIRLHVGGLGQTVSTDDLRKLFSAAGSVEGLDIVRTKGRSFAYVDILPSSSNSLSKLFSTYNGCVWKGGKLKIEKAKEDYLTRLKREWADKEGEETAADQQSIPISSIDRLRIFFPGLCKVKSLPLSGTGKHKYSFQRVEVPALPLNFCDCEEHSAHFDIPKTKEGHFHDERNGGMNEEEVIMMSSIMNKLFNRENVSNTCRDELTLERKNVVKPSEDILSEEEVEEEEENDDDDEDLIINVVSNSNKRAASAMPGRREQQIISNERTRNAKIQVFNDGALQSMTKVNKKNDLHPRKKRKPLPNKEEFREDASDLPIQGKNSELSESESGSEDETDEDGIITNAVSKPNKQMFSSSGGTKLSKKFKSSVIQTSEDGSAPNDQRLQNKDHLLPNKKMDSFSAEERDGEVVSVFNKEKGTQSTAPECGVKQSTTSCSWSQKSSWRALVGDRSNSTFSLSNILQNVEATNEEKQNSNSTKMANASNNGNENFATPNNTTGVLGKKEIVDVLAESQPNQPNTLSSNTGRGSSWIHKSSWVQLVNDNNSSFSISQILPPSTSTKQDVTKPACEDMGNCADGNHSNIMKLHKSESRVDSSAALGAGKGPDTVQSIPESTQQTVEGDAIPAVENTFNLDSNEARGGTATSIGETCSFMRSSASMEEWAKTKAILKGARKKKR